MSTERLDLWDFGMGLLSALRIRGIEVLDENDLNKLHAAFVDAFEVIEKRLVNERLTFAIITHRIHGLSSDVFNIFSYWQGPWATKDSPGTIWRFRMEEQTAENILAKLPGGREVFLQAADAFLLKYRGY